jgi:uncharacterized membrane protein (UPF0127 family)
VQDLVSHLPLALMTLLALAFLVLAVRSDGRKQRLHELAVGGQRVFGSRIVVAKSWLNVRAGLLNHAGLAAGTGLWLKGSRSVHMRGMLFPLDLVFLDGGGRVLAVKANAQPGMATLKGPAGTAHVLEVAAGAARGHFGLTKGELVKLAPLSEA